MHGGHKCKTVANTSYLSSVLLCSLPQTSCNMHTSEHRSPQHSQVLSYTEMTLTNNTEYSYVSTFVHLYMYIQAIIIPSQLFFMDCT